MGDTLFYGMFMEVFFIVSVSKIWHQFAPIQLYKVFDSFLCLDLEIFVVIFLSKESLTLICMLGIFFAIFGLDFFQKSGIVIRVFGSGPAAAGCFIWPDLGPNCLQRFNQQTILTGLVLLKRRDYVYYFLFYVQFLFADNYYDVLVNAINVFPW